jgi:hypothetical protein
MSGLIRVMEMKGLKVFSNEKTGGFKVLSIDRSRFPSFCIHAKIFNKIYGDRVSDERPKPTQQSLFLLFKLSSPTVPTSQLLIMHR